MSTSFVVPHAQDTTRLMTPHRAPLNHLSLTLQVKASVTDDQGVTTTSAPATVQQNEIDTMREEYVELHLLYPVPDTSQFTPYPPTPVLNGVGLNAGDFNYAILDPGFIPRLSVLEARWRGEGKVFQINVIYRSAAHNVYHAPLVGSSGVARNSTHVWGCAADLQTFPTPRNTADRLQRAKTYWQDLSDTAGDVDHTFIFEPATPTHPGGLASGYSHVNVQYCPGSIR